MAHEKLKEALHFVIAQCDDPARLGAIRLNKIAWFSDCYAYRRDGTSVTGDTYVKRKFGPVPRNVLAALRQLEEEGKILAKDVSHYNGTMRRFYSLDRPASNRLSEADREILDTHANVICMNYTANGISNESHDQVWEAAEIGEEIPLYATFASQAGEVTGEVRKWANTVAESLVA